jgi:NADH:ubiquinone oxidoreductase subunit 6 (subunit J)
MSFSLQFTGFLLLSAISVIISNNPIYSVLSLILCFFNASCCLITLGIEFIPISFIVIYVGAISVLFLFVIMMLNIKIVELKQQNLSVYPWMSLFVLLFVIEIMVSFPATNVSKISAEYSYAVSEFVDASNDLVNMTQLKSRLSNITSIGTVLFCFYNVQLIISGLILLIAMLGSIILTLHKTFISRYQLIAIQVLTSQNATLSTFKNNALK